MIKQISILGLLLVISWSSLAQTTPSQAAELNSTPPTIVSGDTPQANVETPTALPTLTKRKISYGISAGTQFSRLYGTTTFLEPSVMFPVTRRFSGFASLSFVNSFGANSRYYGSETGGAGFSPYSQQRYILNAGGNYIVNEKLNITGQVWRDFSRNPMPTTLNVFNPGSTSGVLMRANYKLTDHLSVSGGIRVSNGNAYNNLWYNPMPPFGF